MLNGWRSLMYTSLPCIFEIAFSYLYIYRDVSDPCFFPISRFGLSEWDVTLCFDCRGCHAIGPSGGKFTLCSCLKRGNDELRRRRGQKLRRRTQLLKLEALVQGEEWRDGQIHQKGPRVFPCGAAETSTWLVTAFVHPSCGWMGVVFFVCFCFKRGGQSWGRRQITEEEEEEK